MKIDYTYEYRKLLDAVVGGKFADIFTAAHAMGLEYSEGMELTMLFVKMTDRFDIGGNSAEDATCYLKEEYCI